MNPVARQFASRYRARVQVRVFGDADWPQVWTIMREVVQAQDTFPYDPEMTEKQPHQSWIGTSPGLTVVGVNRDRILGTAKMGPAVVVRVTVPRPVRVNPAMMK